MFPMLKALPTNTFTMERTNTQIAISGEKQAQAVHRSEAIETERHEKTKREII